jgi:hypothetical protein
MGTVDKTSNPADNPSVVRELRTIASLVVERKVQFLCGAGMSKASGCPLAGQLAAEIVAAMLGETVTSDIRKLAELYPFEAIAGAYVQKRDRRRLTGLIERALEAGKGKKHAGHDALVYLADQGYIDRVYTTNFDSLIEDAFSTRAATPVTDDDAYLVHEARAKNEIPVLHLHGRLEGGKYLIAEGETYDLDTPLARILMADLVTHWFVWVGYSLNDVDLRSMYLSMRDMLARTQDLVKKPYVVHPLGSGDVTARLELELATAIWESRGASFVPMTAEEFLPALVTQVKRFEGDKWAIRLALKFGFDPASDEDLQQVWERARQLSLDLMLENEVEGMKALAQREGIEV